MRYSGVMGYAVNTEVSPGVYEDIIQERPYLGNVEQRTETFVNGDTLIPNYRLTTSVSVLSDGVFKDMYENLRYIEYKGIRWTASSIVHGYPRITIYLGEVYNGPTQ